jgi:hypothetical protein
MKPLGRPHRYGKRAGRLSATKGGIHEHPGLYSRDKTRVVLDKRRLEITGVKVDIPSGRK